MKIFCFIAKNLLPLGCEKHFGLGFEEFEPSVVMPSFSSHISVPFISLLQLVSVSYFPLHENWFILWSEAQECFILVLLKQIVLTTMG